MLPHALGGNVDAGAIYSFYSRKDVPYIQAHVIGLDWQSRRKA